MSRIASKLYDHPARAVVWEIHWKLPTGTKRLDVADNIDEVMRLVRHAVLVADGEITLKPCG